MCNGRGRDGRGGGGWIGASRRGGFWRGAGSRGCGLGRVGRVFAIIKAIITSAGICLSCIRRILCLIMAFTILCCLTVRILRNQSIRSSMLCSVYELRILRNDQML